MGAEMVFISYSSKNAELADAMVAYLEKKGITCWYAPRNIEPGSEWVPAIKSALQTTKVFVLLYTPQSNQSRQVMNEVALAFNAGKTMVPYCATDEKMNDELEYYLTRVHWLNAVNKPQEECFEELSKLIEGNLHRMNVEIHPVDAETMRKAEAVRKAETMRENWESSVAGIVREAETVREAGTTRENWTALEAGATTEAGTTRENWTAPEAGATTEAGTTRENRTAPEAGATPEAGTTRENWTAPEAGVTPAAGAMQENRTVQTTEVNADAEAEATVPGPAAPEAPKASSGYVAGQEAEAAVRAIKAMREARKKEALDKTALEDEADDKKSGWGALNGRTRKIILWGGVAAGFLVLLLLGILLGTKLAKSGKEDPEDERVESESSREIADSKESSGSKESSVSKDDGKAWEESIAALSAVEKRELGYQYLDGYGVEQDVELGRKLLKQAGDEGDFEAKVAYGKDLLYGTSGGAIDEEEGVRVLKQIVDGGSKDPGVMTALADYYDAAKSYREALRYYQFASDVVTDENVCLKLAEYYLEGKGTKKDAEVAKGWLNRSRGVDPYSPGADEYDVLAYFCIYGMMSVPSNLKYDVILQAAEEGDPTSAEWLVQKYFDEKKLMRIWEQDNGGSEISLDEDGNFIYDRFTTGSEYRGTYEIKKNRIIFSFEIGGTWTAEFHFQGEERFMDMTVQDVPYRFIDVTEKYFSLD